MAWAAVAEAVPRSIAAINVLCVMPDLGVVRDVLVERSMLLSLSTDMLSVGWGVCYVYGGPEWFRGLAKFCYSNEPSSNSRIEET
jgi:hypothetical protein